MLKIEIDGRTFAAKRETLVAVHEALVAAGWTVSNENFCHAYTRPAETKETKKNA